MSIFTAIATAIVRANDEAKQLPPPNHNCRAMDDYNEQLLMFRNRERYTQQSLSMPSLHSVLPLAGVGDGSKSLKEIQ